MYAKPAVCIAMWFGFWLAISAFAEMPRIISYQGRLAETDGKSVVSGLYFYQIKNDKHIES